MITNDMTINNPIDVVNICLCGKIIIQYIRKSKRRGRVSYYDILSLHIDNQTKM